jgi:hypothetical protein
MLTSEWFDAFSKYMLNGDFRGGAFGGSVVEFSLPMWETQLDFL